MNLQEQNKIQKKGFVFLAPIIPFIPTILAWIGGVSLFSAVVLHPLNEFTHLHIEDIKGIKDNLKNVLWVISQERSEGFKNPQVQKIFEDYEKDAKTVYDSIDQMFSITEGSQNAQQAQEQIKAMQDFVNASNNLKYKEASILGILESKQDASSWLAGSLKKIPLLPLNFGLDLTRYDYFQTLINQISSKVSAISEQIKVLFDGIAQKIKEQEQKQSEKPPQSDDFSKISI